MDRQETMGTIFKKIEEVFMIRFPISKVSLLINSNKGGAMRI